MHKKPFHAREASLHAAAGRGSSAGESGGRGAGRAAGRDDEPGAAWGDALSVADRQRAELWAAELPLMVRDAGRSREFAPRTACRLLTRWARLSRLDRGALPPPRRPDDDDLFKALDYIRDNGAELAEAAALATDAAAWAGAWVERATKLKASYGDDADDSGGAEMSSADRESLAGSLLLDLDDLELADYACRKFGPARPDLLQALATCRAWVAGHADAFLAAGPRVRSELALMRRDLPVADPDLAGTAVKFLHVRSAVEEMEDALAFGRA